MEEKKKKRLDLKLLSTALDFFGVWEVTVSINGKEYTYVLTSEYAHSRFNAFYNRHQSGRALACLNHFKSKLITKEEVSLDGLENLSN